MIGIVTFSACTKDSKEDAHLSQRNTANNAFIYYEQNQLESKLNQFWVNYQSFLGLEIESPHNLGATVGLDEATTLLHYALNIAFVDPRIAYDQEVDGMFEKNINWAQGEQITNLQLCSIFHNIAADIKNARNQIADANKAINRLEIIPQATANSVSFQIKYLLSHGNIWSKEDLSDPANTTWSQNLFTAPIPWISQQSYQNENPNVLPPGATIGPLQQHYMMLFTNSTSNNRNTLINIFNSNLQNVRAAHHYLSSNAVYRPLPLMFNTPNPGVVHVNKIPVATPFAQTEVPLFATDDHAVKTRDVLYCNNPYSPQPDVIEQANDLVPSMLLGYFGTEYTYSYTQPRTLNRSKMEFFRQHYPQIALKAVVKNEGQINRVKTARTTTAIEGFFAMTKFEVTPNKNTVLNCGTDPECGRSSFCMVGAEYFLKPQYSHYRLLPITPAILRDNNFF